MVTRKNCCVPECKTGLRTNTTTAKISYHKFPKNDELRKRWISKVHRQNIEENDKDIEKRNDRKIYNNDGEIKEQQWRVRRM